MKNRMKSRRKLHSRKKKGGNTLEPLETLIEQERELQNNLNESQNRITALDAKVSNYEKRIETKEKEIKDRTWPNWWKTPIRPRSRKRQENRIADLTELNEKLNETIKSRKSEVKNFVNIRSKLIEKQQQINDHEDTIKENIEKEKKEKLYHERREHRRKLEEEIRKERLRKQERERGQSEITSRLLQEEKEQDLQIDETPSKDPWLEGYTGGGGKKRKTKKNKYNKSRKPKSRKPKSRKPKSRK